MRSRNSEPTICLSASVSPCTKRLKLVAVAFNDGGESGTVDLVTSASSGSSVS